jgi:hypothetical protein
MLSIQNYTTPYFYIDCIQDYKTYLTDQIFVDSQMNTACKTYLYTQTALAKTLAANTLQFYRDLVNLTFNKTKQ